MADDTWEASFDDADIPPPLPAESSSPSQWSSQPSGIPFDDSDEDVPTFQSAQPTTTANQLSKPAEEDEWAEAVVTSELPAVEFNADFPDDAQDVTSQPPAATVIQGVPSPVSEAPSESFDRSGSAVEAISPDTASLDNSHTVTPASPTSPSPTTDAAPAVVESSSQSPKSPAQLSSPARTVDSEHVGDQQSDVVSEEEKQISPKPDDATPAFEAEFSESAPASDTSANVGVPAEDDDFHASPLEGNNGDFTDEFVEAQVIDADDDDFGDFAAPVADTQSFESEFDTPSPKPVPVSAVRSPPSSLLPPPGSRPRTNSTVKPLLPPPPSANSATVDKNVSAAVFQLPKDRVKLDLNEQLTTFLTQMSERFGKVKPLTKSVQELHELHASLKQEALAMLENVTKEYEELKCTQEKPNLEMYRIPKPVRKPYTYRQFLAERGKAQAPSSPQPEPRSSSTNAGAVVNNNSANGRSAVASSSNVSSSTAKVVKNVTPEEYLKQLPPALQQAIANLPLI
jgi:hypothetical protein